MKVGKSVEDVIIQIKMKPFFTIVSKINLRKNHHSRSTHETLNVLSTQEVFCKISVQSFCTLIVNRRRHMKLIDVHLLYQFS